MNKKDNICNILKLTLMVLLILFSIFRYKNIYIEPNNVLEVSLSYLIYPFTFLFILLLKDKISFKKTHRVILSICLLFLIYNILLSLLNSIPSNINTLDTDNYLKQALTNKYITLGNFNIYYPNLLDTVSTTLLFYFSHTLILILYDAMIPYTNKFIACSLSMFIPYTLDVLCSVIINNTFLEIEFNTMIINILSNFVIVIVSTIIISIIYSIIKVRSKKELKA